jgi:hypothetical protein
MQAIQASYHQKITAKSYLNQLQIRKGTGTGKCFIVILNKVQTFKDIQVLIKDGSLKRQKAHI